MGQLHEVLAARTKRDNQAKEALAQAKKILSHETLFEAHLQTYRHMEDDPSGLHSERPKSTHLTTTVGRVLAELQENIIPQLDLNLTIDLTNTKALGNLALEGLDLPALPTTQLLALKKSVEQMAQVLTMIPTHDPKQEWEPDTGLGAGIFKTEPQISYRTTKRIFHEVVVPPTKEHRAEIRERSEDIVTGEVTKKYWSGKLTRKQKTELLKKTENLIEALSVTLAKANQVEAVPGHIGQKLFSWLFSDIPME